MKKIKTEKVFSYSPKSQFTKKDIIEIYNNFKQIDDSTKIRINKIYELDEISELNDFPAIDSVVMVMNYLSDYFGTFLLIDKNGISLSLNDSDDLILLGLKSKFETILNNRENPTDKKSIINHEEKNVPQIPFINQGTVVLGNNNITGSRVEGITNIGNGAKVENPTIEKKLNKTNIQESGKLRDNIKTKTKPKTSEPSDLALEIIDYAKLAIVAMVCIYIVYIVAANFAGQLPAQIASIILGIALLFIFLTSSSFRESIMNLGKNKK